MFSNEIAHGYKKNIFYTVKIDSLLFVLSVFFVSVISLSINSLIVFSFISLCFFIFIRKVKVSYIDVFYLLFCNVTILACFFPHGEYSSFNNIYLSIFKILIVINGLFILRLALPLWQYVMVLKFLFSISFIKTVLIILYSYKVGFRGYGSLFDPFSNEHINSPAIALILSAAAITLAFLFKRKLILFPLCIIWFASCFYLQSRASQLVFALFIVFFILKANKRSIFCLAVFGISLLSLLLYFFGNLFDYGVFQGGISLSIFDKGLESNRFYHWAFGINKLLDNPFGGFTPDSNYEDVTSFHNIFLDVGKTSGVIGVILLFIFFLYSMVTSFSNKYIRSSSIYLPIIIMFVLMQQDVILDGNNLLFFMFFSLVLIGLNRKGFHGVENEVYFRTK